MKRRRREIWQDRLKAVDLAVLLLDDTDFAEEVFDMLSLVAGQLNDLSVLGMLHDGTVAVILL